MGRQGSRRRARILPAFVLVTGVAVSVLAGLSEADARREAADVAFRARADLAQNQVQERIDTIQGALEAFRASMILGWPVEPDDFSVLVTAARRQESLDPVVALAFARAVPGPGAAGDGFVIEYVQPIAGNETAIGYDLGTEASRRAAVEAARDTGLAVATPPIDLVADATEGAAVLLVHAVYAGEVAPATVEARRAAFVGVVSTPVGIEELLARVLGPHPEIRLAVFDVGEATGGAPGSLDAGRRLHRSEGAEIVDEDGRVAGHHVVRDLDVGGRRWRLVMVPSSPIDVGTLPWAVTGAGSVIAALLAAVVGATAGARARAEALVERRTAELRRMVLDAPDATLVVDDEGTVQLASNQVRTVLGYEPDELVGRNVDALVPDEVRDRHAGHRGSFAAAPSARPMRLPRGELRARHRDGHDVPVEINLAPIPDGGVIASVRDVSLQQAARLALQESHDQQIAFLGTVSHELRTPLVAIRGFVGLLGDGDRSFDDAERAEFLRRIGRNADSLQALIEELLEYSRLERDAFTVAPVPGDLAATVGEVLDELSTSCDDHRLRVDLTPAVCRLDPYAIRRIVGNLVTNACRYSPAGSEVRVTVEPRGDDAVLVVEDEGPGIDPADRAHVFERFWRGSNATVAAVGGTGLGLAVVADLVALLDGAVTVGAATGGGARFEVVLPSGSGRAATALATPVAERPATLTS